MTAAPQTGPAPSASGGAAKLLVPFAIGAAVTITLGVYGQLHEPTGVAVNVARFSGPLTVKVWLASFAFVFGLVQLVTALAMYGKLPSVSPAAWMSGVH